MSLLIQSFYRNVQTICSNNVEADLFRYLSADGLSLLKEILRIEIQTSFNQIECRDFGHFLIKLIPICYSQVTNDDALQALHHLPSIESNFDCFSSSEDEILSISPLFRTLNFLFDTVVHLFDVRSKSELNNAHIEIAQVFLTLSLPTLNIEANVLWFYQKFIRSSLRIFHSILFFSQSKISIQCITSLIHRLHQFLPNESSTDLINFTFDLLVGFATLIERFLTDPSDNHNDLLNLIEQYLTSDYFALFTQLISFAEFHQRSEELLEHCSMILKRLKIYRSEQNQRKSRRRYVQTSWENNADQTSRFHSHQINFELMINQNNAETKSTDSDEINSNKRICVVSSIYDKLLRLIVKQLENPSASLTFIHNGLNHLISFGSCSCYPLTHYRTFLSKLNHLKLEKKFVVSLEQQSIQLLRQAFLLISNCSQRHHHHDNTVDDHSQFWSYLALHLFQRATPYALQLARVFPDLIQYCTNTEKKLALKHCLIPTFDYFRVHLSNQTTMIEYLVQTLANLLFDMIIDIPLNPLSDTLIALASSCSLLLPQVLPVLGCLLTSTSDCATVEISESFLQLILRLTTNWDLNHDGIDNLCHLLIILLQKSATFRRAFYGHLCHLRVYEHFRAIMTDGSTIQSSILACILVCISYYPKVNDETFRYRQILDDLTYFSLWNRTNQSWFDLLIRLSLSQQYQDRRIRWKSCTKSSSSSSSTGARTTFSIDIEEQSEEPSIDNDVDRIDDDEDEIYPADVESLSDDLPRQTMKKQRQNLCSNLIIFPELIMLGLKTVWENVDREWSDQQSAMKTPIYLTNLVNFLEVLSSLVRANSYNCFILKKLNLDEYLFHYLMTIVRRATFVQKDALITLIITLLQFLWSQSITVHQLDQCFKLILSHRSLLAPLLRLFKHLVQQIDSNQPRSFCSMPLSSIVTSKGGVYSRLTLEQLLTLKYPCDEHPTNTNVRQLAFVTEKLKNLSFQYPLSVAIWLRVNYPFAKNETLDENIEDEETTTTTKKDTRCWLHLVTLQHETVQYQFWVDSTPTICLKILPVTSTNQKDSTIRLCNLPRESWSHLFVSISKTNNTLYVCLNGQTSLAKRYPISNFSSSNSSKPWSISLGQQPLDVCTSFYYDLGSILLFDKIDLIKDYLPTYLYSLGSDHWHFLTSHHQQQQSAINYWIYQRFSRVHSSIPIDQFDLEQSHWHTALKRSLIASYSSNNPWTLYLFNLNSDTNEDLVPSRLTKILPFRSSTSSTNLSTVTISDESLGSASATISLPSKISVEQSSHILNSCEQLGGILNFIYLFGKIVEVNSYPSSMSICEITDIIFTSIWKIKSYYDLFMSLDGYRLIVKILITNECSRHINQIYLETLNDKCFINNQQRLYDIDLFRYVFLEWKIWFTHPDIFSQILDIFNKLLSDQSNPKYFFVNRQLFKKQYFTLEHLLTICQELIEEQEKILIDEKLTGLLVNIIEALTEHEINIIALLMNFVLVIHPLIKTYVTYNKEQFYFLNRPFESFRRVDQQEKVSEPRLQRQTPIRPRSITMNTDEHMEMYSLSSIRKSHSFADLLTSSKSSTNDHSTVPSNSKTFHGDSNLMTNKDPWHNIDCLSTGILRLLTNIALTSSDRLMIKLIENIFHLNILIVLLMDGSMNKRVQCLKFVDIILKRMDREKVSQEVLQLDLHTMLANQIYHQLDGNSNEKDLVQICLAITLQRPIDIDLDNQSSLTERIDDPDQFFSIVSSSPSCPRSQVGFALILSLIEKLSLFNRSLCELLLDLLNEILRRATDENRHFLVEIGLTAVLFNTLSSAIARDDEKLIQCVQKCFNSLISRLFLRNYQDDITFASIIENLIAMIGIPTEQNQQDPLAQNYRRIVHQTLSNMFISIIDTIEKPPVIELTNKSRPYNDENNLNTTLMENAERFRLFLQLASDYLSLFHQECALIESVTLRLLDLLLLGMAYFIEKRSNQTTHRHQWSLVMFRSGDPIKQGALKLLILALDPEKQRFFFRVEILKHVIGQPNSKGILEYLLTNDHQSAIYHQLLVYLHLLSNTKPTDFDYEPVNPAKKVIPPEQRRRSFDSGNLTVSTSANFSKPTIVSNSEESSSHTVNLTIRPSIKKPIEKYSTMPIASKLVAEPAPSTDDESPLKKLSETSSTSDEEEKLPGQRLYEKSSSLSMSTSSLNSEITNVSFQVTATVNYAATIHKFRDLMRSINIQSLTSNDNQWAQRRGLSEYLITMTSSQTLRHQTQRHSFDWPVTSRNSFSTLPSRNRERRSQLSPPASTISWASIVDERRQEYKQSLQLVIDNLQKRSLVAQKMTRENFEKKVIATITDRAMNITQEVINLQGFERKKYLEHLRSNQSLDLRTKNLWHQLIAQLTHEYGIWFEAASYPKFWELDPTENPQRERRRLQRSYCLMEKRFFQAHVPDEAWVSPPLSYLFDTRHYQSINALVVLYRNEKIEFQCRCLNVTPSKEIKGELLVCLTRIYFVADEQLSALTNGKSVNSTMGTVSFSHNDSNSFSFAIDDICEMYKRRYMLQDNALELFLVNGMTWMITHVSTRERDNLHRLLSKRYMIHYRHEESLGEIQFSWRHGQMTNFEYLMQLNKLAGRTYLDLMQYPVYPYVCATYETSVFDLRLTTNYRNLAKPIAIQHPEKEEKFIEIYKALDDAHQLAMLNEQDQDQSEPLNSVFGHQSKPYHYASLYSNSGVVLHYLLRLLPYTRMFLDYQDNNFDCADRTFHDVKTSFWLSSFESTSDFKELIPEFYYLHEFLMNKQGFNFGTRQNGEKVSDVTLPVWAKRNARLYVCALRQALESEYVTSHIHQWIDLIFGYKQIDKPALDAVNVYHAACYFGFPIESINDQLTRKAYYGIIRTYGQVPKQLFRVPHPGVATTNPILSSSGNFNANEKRASERAVFESKLPLDSIHRQVIGVRWGDFVGSYDMPSPDYISRLDCPVPISSFVVLSNGSCIICLPSSSLIIHNEHLNHDSARRLSMNDPQLVSISSSSSTTTSSTTSTSLDPMIALKWNTPEGIVRCRPLKQIKHWYNILVPMDDQDKITCCTSIDSRLLFMGKTSGLIEVYRIQRNKNIPAGIELDKRYLPFIAHRSPITCLYANRHFSLLISASADGMLTLWDTNRLSYVRTCKQDNQPIYHLTSSETTGDIAYLSSSGSQWHLSYLTCNCDLVGCLTFSEQLNCLCFTSAPEGTGVNVLLGGFENGLISMWSTWDLTLLRQLDFSALRTSSIVALCVSKVDRRRLYVADRDRRLHTIESRVPSSTSSVQPSPQILFLS